jgi:hypothetical protein
MASTYVNDLRLNEMATGDGSGTWGTTTNTNLELIAEAFSYGTEAITTNADTHTTTIADGATDPGRALYLKYTGTLDSACTITIGPNTVSKVWIVENATSGSQNIILSQGSGANITIPAGDTKVVYSDGAGAGAAFFDAFASLNVVDLKVQDDLTVTDDASIGGDATITGTLGVTGNITGTLATAAQPNITSVGTLTALTGGTGDLNWDSGTLFVDSSANNVGIGTTSVGTKLNIRSDASDDGILLEKSDGTDIARLFYDGTSTNARFDMFSGGSATVQIKASGDTHFSGGNVGIGTGSPTKLLEISDSTTGDAQYLNIHNVGGGSVNDETSIQFQHGGTRRSSRISSTLTSSTTTNLMFSTEAGGSVVERLRIDSSGGLITKPAAGGHAVFNENSVDADFRVESDTSTHALFVDGGTSRVGINKAAPDRALDVHSGSASDITTFANDAGSYTFGKSANMGSLDLAADASFRIRHGATESVRFGPSETTFNEGSADVDFRVESDGNANALFVDASANVTYIGKNTGALGTAGFYFAANTGNAEFTGDGSSDPLRINRLASDGTLIAFYQATSPEGSISVSGSTVSYNGFAGRHESSGIATTTAKGTVVSTIDELDEYLSGPRQGQTRADHAKVKVSETVGDARVYGVVDDFTNEGKLNTISVGIGSIKVTGACAGGDLLESNGDGTAKVQADDIIRSKTIGKVTIGNSNTGVKLVSCVLYCG